MAKVTEAMLVDKRIVERNINKGLISKEDYRAHLASLQDRADAVELVSIEPPEDEAEESAAEPASAAAVW
jgi:hypothetical protein